jgi:hypothetical protein
MMLHQLFNMKCERIKMLSAEALSQANMFAGFRYHRPNMTYYDTLAAARNLRECADILEAMAEKIKPALRDVA